MNVSAIGCTSIKPNQSSFKARKHDEDYTPRHNHAGETVKKALVAASVFTAGTLATKSVSGKLLNKISNDSAFAQKIGQKVLDFGQFVENKLDAFNPTKKLLVKGKVLASDLVASAKKFASKGLGQEATGQEKAINGVKKTLTYMAGGSAGLAAAADSNNDGETNIKDLAGNILLNVAGAAVD